MLGILNNNLSEQTKLRAEVDSWEKSTARKIKEKNLHRTISSMPMGQHILRLLIEFVLSMPIQKHLI